MSNSPLRILEVEDGRFVPICASMHLSNKCATTRKKGSTQSEEEEVPKPDTINKSQDSCIPPKLGPESPPPAIDDHTPFWSTYDRVAGAHDRELLDAWNKSLDVLLIFAGLFSAINTAFIIESYRNLQPDPIDTNNYLLRLLITHRNDNVTLSFDDLNPGFSASSAVPINSLFFSSLSLSLTAAFGAVNAKQWLAEYANVGTTKALHVQGRKRQAKYQGLKTWHLRLIIELLPMLLQMSLLLFFVGVARFLWVLDRKVATVQLAVSATGVAIYLLTTTIGIIIPTSPFQTPFSKYIRQFFIKSYLRLKALSHFLTEAVVSVVGKVRGVKVVVAIFRTNATGALSRLQYIVAEIFLVFRCWIGSSGELDRETINDEVMQWDTVDITAAKSVIWLLEQAENRDVTITALDAIPRIPPTLILSLVQKSDGLLERLIQFHDSALPPASSGHRDINWMKAWPNTAIVSGAALWHIMKAQHPSESQIKSASLLQRIDMPSNRWLSMDENPLAITKFALNHSFESVSQSSSLLLFGLEDIFQSMTSLSAHSHIFSVHLTDSHRPSANNSFATSTSPLPLALDCAIYHACEHPDHLGNPWVQDMFLTVLDSLASILEGELSREIVSHVAIAVAAIQWSRLHYLLGHPLTADSTLLRQLIIARSRDLDKGRMILENIALAVSTINRADPSCGICNILLAITSNLFYEKFGGTNTAIPFRKFPQGLLLLARASQDDPIAQFQIVKLLSLCSDGDWVSPLHQDTGADLIQVLDSVLASASVNSNTSPIELYCVMLDKIARVSDNSQLLRIIGSLGGLCEYCRAIANVLVPKSTEFALEFIRRTLQLQADGLPEQSLLLEVQISFVVIVLTRRPLLWDSAKDAILDFLNRSLDEETEHCWPSYFISAGIPLPSGNQASHTVPWTSIPTSQFADLVTTPGRLDIRDQHMLYIWYGEGILLLWRKGKKEYSRGRLHKDWNDSLFFEDSVLGMMLLFWQQIQEQMYSGIDYGMLKEYFKKALDLSRWAVEVEGHRSRREQQTKQELCRKLETAMYELDAHLNSSPSRRDEVYQ